MRTKHNIGDFKRFFEGAKIFLTPNCPECSEGQFRGQKSRGPLEKSWEFADYVFCQHIKNNITNYYNQLCIGIKILINSNKSVNNSQQTTLDKKVPSFLTPKLPFQDNLGVKNCLLCVCPHKKINPRTIRNSGAVIFITPLNTEINCKQLNSYINVHMVFLCKPCI
jgi:hypothetical protein